MKINFKEISIHNFLSIGDAKVNLEDFNTTLVKGINHNKADAALSNGSGKSSLFNAICWALTGETIQGVSSNIANIHREGGCCVELYFSVDSDDYVIKRYREHHKMGNDLKIIKNNEDISGKGIRESSKVLADLLPDLNSELLGSIIILGQGLPHKFTDNTPAGRKEVLEKLSKSDFMVEDIKNRLNERKEELSNSLGEIRIKISNSKTLEQSSISRQASLESELIGLLGEEEFKKNISDLTREVDSRQSFLKGLNDSLIQAEDKVGQINTDLNDNTNTHYEKKQTVLNKYNISELDSSLSALNAQISLLNNMILSKESVPDICPTCGQKMPADKKVDTSQDRAQLESFKADYNKIKEEKTTLTAKLEEELGQLDKDYKQKGDDLRSTLDIYTQKVKGFKMSINQTQQEITQFTASLEQMKAGLANLRERSNQLNSYIDAEIATQKKLKEEIVCYSREENRLTEHLDAVQNMFTLVKRDFRGYLLSNVIEFISQKAKEYSKYIFNGEAITFELSGNSIDVGYDGKMYENLSGGEKQKVDLILQFSLKDMLCQYLNVQCNILVLDEIFDNLDSVGCSRVLNLISNIDSIENIYIISHHADELEIPYDKELIIEKDSSGVSQIK